jgi:hypothetical protein
MAARRPAAISDYALERLVAVRLIVVVLVLRNQNDNARQNTDADQAGEDRNAAKAFARSLNFVPAVDAFTTESDEAKLATAGTAMSEVALTAADLVQIFGIGPGRAICRVNGFEQLVKACDILDRICSREPAAEYVEISL